MSLIIANLLWKWKYIWSLVQFSCTHSLQHHPHEIIFHHNFLEISTSTPLLPPKYIWLLMHANLNLYTPSSSISLPSLPVATIFHHSIWRNIALPTPSSNFLSAFDYCCSSLPPPLPSNPPSPSTILLKLYFTIPVL
jgi:hypothetical protein